MFTGIIEEIGKALTVTNNSIKISASKVLEETKIGDSIAVNGVCLTVTNIGNDCFEADVSPETFKITALNHLRNGSTVNLERALPANGRFGGHIVSGHIDGVGNIVSIKKNSEFYDLEIKLTENLSKYVVKKGSIAIDGISLTVAQIEDNKIKIAIIPHTFESTNLTSAKVGNAVNIETDIISKYVEKFLSSGDNKKGIDMEFLTENGF